MQNSTDGCKAVITATLGFVKVASYSDEPLVKVCPGTLQQDSVMPAADLIECPEMFVERKKRVKLYEFLEAGLQS